MKRNRRRLDFGGWIQEGAEFHGGGRAAVGQGLGRAGRSEDAVKDHAIVAVVGGVAVAVPVPGVQVEFHVPAHQARRFSVDEGVPEVRARFGASCGRGRGLLPGGLRWS